MAKSINPRDRIGENMFAYCLDCGETLADETDPKTAKSEGRKHRRKHPCSNVITGSTDSKQAIVEQFDKWEQQS